MKKSLWAKFQGQKTGPGGTKCDCCNDYFGHHRKKLQKLVRHLIKRESKKDISDATEDN